MPRLAKPTAWVAIVALAILSLTPKQQMLRTGAGGWIEHFVAYLGATPLIALAYGQRLGIPRLAAALVAYAAVLELAQSLSPGRTPALPDFLAGVGGVAIAALACSVLPLDRLARGPGRER